MFIKKKKNFIKAFIMLLRVLSVDNNIINDRMDEKIFWKALGNDRPYGMRLYWNTLS